MTRLLALHFLFLTGTPTIFGQPGKSEEEFKPYLNQLHAIKVDTVLIIKSGCTGCEIRYNDTSAAITDGQSIYVLTQHNGKFSVAFFDDLKPSKFTTVDTCSLFELITQNKSALRQKKYFYEKEIPKIKSKSGFYPLSSVHYSYEDVTIQLSNFNYDFQIVDGNKDHFGLSRDKEKWFIATTIIIRRFFSFFQPIKD